MPDAANGGVPSGGPGFDDFLALFAESEAAWLLLDQAALSDDADKRAALTAAVERGARSSAILVRAAEQFTGLGRDEEARAALEQALALTGPTAPAQIAYARNRRAAGDIEGAGRWYRGGLLRARPDIALMLDYAAVEQEAGEPDRARRIAEAARGLPPGDPAALIDAGRRLAGLGRPDLAGIAFAAAYRRGHRADDLLRLIGATDDGPAGPLAGPIDPAIPGGPNIRAAAASMVIQEKLAASPLLAAAAAAAAARERSSNWVPFERLAAFLREQIDRREPFSWIRLGDGEARFLLHARPDLRFGLDETEVGTVVGLIWTIWFGRPFAEADPRRVVALGDAFAIAIRNASLLGVTSAERLAGDHQHRGYCAALEHYLGKLPPPPEQSVTDAAFNVRLNERDPFFERLLHGLDFLGVIGPHPDLADRLGRRLGIGRSVSYLIPGEGRIGGARERGNRGQHFPAVFDQVMNDLTVPFRGAVFLVAGGLLGKVYCERIRALGGIALDIGALADAWVGINTRGAPLDLSLRQVLPA